MRVRPPPFAPMIALVLTEEIPAIMLARRDEDNDIMLCMVRVSPAQLASGDDLYVHPEHVLWKGRRPYE